VIVYRLICSSGHEFDGWFRDSNTFDAQSTKGTLECPVCGDKKLSKAIMAPALKKRTESVPAQSPMAPPDSQKIQQFMAGYRKFIQDNAEYVGPKFPEEARKIHYGEAEERHIYGESSLKEARELIEEGIEVAPVPPDPGDLN
jgi:hypothetical protein